MLRHWLIALMIVTLAGVPAAFAQTQAAPKAQAQPTTQRKDKDDDDEGESKVNSNVAPSAAVITIEGLCDTSKTAAKTTASKASCKTVVTREEFEELANTLQPGMPGPVRRQLANAYPRLLVMAKEAQKRGIDKDPHYLESVKFAKLQLLNQELNRRLQEEAAKVPEQDIQDYYNKNLPSYEQAALQRVFVPRVKQMDPPKEGTSPDELKAREQEAADAMTKVAEGLRARAAAGEDFEKLEKEAYEAAGLKANPPSTSIPKIRRVNLPPAHATIFDLKPGEVSQLINDPSGHYFYKMQSKSTPPLDEVRQEIHATLQTQRMHAELQKLQDSVTTDLNEAYFGGNPPPPTRGGASDPDHKPTAKADRQ